LLTIDRAADGESRSPPGHVDQEQSQGLGELCEIHNNRLILGKIMLRAAVAAVIAGSVARGAEAAPVAWVL
jgi:hypothetical protein